MNEQPVDPKINKPVTSSRDAQHTHGFFAVLRSVVPFLFKAAPAEKQVQPAKQTATPRIIVHKHHSHRRAAARARRHEKRAEAHITVPVAVKKTDSAPTTVSASSTLPPPPPLPPAEKKPEQPATTPPANISPEPTGVLLVPKEQKEKDQPKVSVDLEKEKLEHEEGWMQKVVKSKAVAAPAVKRSGWKMVWDRFFRRLQEPVFKSKAAPLSKKDTEELKNDTFLKHVQEKQPASIVGTDVTDEKPQQPEPLAERTGHIVMQEEAKKVENRPSVLENFAAGADAVRGMVMPQSKPEEKPVLGRIISATELRKEAEAAKAAERRVEEETRKEMVAEEKAKKKEEKKKEASLVPHVHIQSKNKSGFQRFLTSLSHVGLGKQSLEFTQNLATMLNAGLPLTDALQTLIDETRSKAMKKMIQRIRDTVENGSPLWRAMDAEEYFSLHAIALIRIGEEAGNLADNIQYLADQEEKDHELRQKVTMAMIYPSIVLTVMFIIVMGLGLFVLPNLTKVLTSLNVPLPLMTRIVIGFSNGLTTYGAIVIPAILGGMLALFLLAKFTRFKIVTQWVIFKIPGIGSLLRESTIARFGVILGGLLKAGVPVLEAVQSLIVVTPVLSYRRLYEKMLDHLTIGDSFAKSFASIRGSRKLLPPSVQQLVITGEKSGALAQIMLKVAEIYDKKASETAQKLPVILEPMLLLVIGAMVGTIAFSVIVPIYSIVGSIGH